MMREYAPAWLRVDCGHGTVWRVWKAIAIWFKKFKGEGR